MAVTKRIEQDNIFGTEDEADFPAPPVETHTFDPARHIVRLRGGDYLEVKWRLLWLRLEHPNAGIETEMVHFDLERKLAVFKALITLPNGGSATGWGSESSDDFKDFIEKAETKAIGRACAALGFGTQHCLDFDYDSNSSGKVVDAPVNYLPSGNGNGSSRASSPATTGNGFVSAANPNGALANSNLATEKQVKMIYGIGSTLGLKEEQVAARCKEKFGVEPEQLTRNGASRFIDLLRQPA